MDIPTIAKARNLQPKDIKRPFVMQIGYVMLLCGIIYSFVSTLLFLMPTFLIFGFCMLFAIDWSY